MKTLITGATGFLGGALARRLHGLGWDVTALGRNPRALAALNAEGIRTLQADLADESAIRAACVGQEIVFHSGALSAPWGRGEEFYRANVLGTRHIVRGCQDANVQRLVHVSTPSIYFRYEPRLNVKETDPLPAKPINEYARTKLLAEAEVDRAHADGLPVVSIRPRAIFGPGDTTILPRLIQRLASGRLPVIGDGKNIADLSYVENVVDALLLCVESPRSTFGKKYNITNGESVVLWDMIRKVAEALGYPSPRGRIPYRIADAFAGLLEVTCRLLPSQPEPPLTRYTVGVIANSTTLDISAARRDLGYNPRISVEEGFEKFIDWWKANH